MSYGGARYVGTGREFALMHNPFVTLYVRYARTHFYFAYSLVLLCVLLAILDIPGYASATFGAWMVALSLLFAPFWFNPVQFVVSQTKADYKQFSRWLQGEEEDPDSKLTWFTWHDRQMAKIRNENSNITDHYLNGIRSIIWSVVTNGLLFLAAISQLRTNDDLDRIDDLEKEIEKIENAMARARSTTVKDLDILVKHKNTIQSQLMREKDDHLGISSNSFDKKLLKYGKVTLGFIALGAVTYLLHSCMRARGKQRGARIIKVAALLLVILASIVLAQYNGFLVTRDHKNGWRNLMLIYYSNLNLVIIIISVGVIGERGGLIDVSVVLGAFFLRSGIGEAHRRQGLPHVGPNLLYDPLRCAVPLVVHQNRVDHPEHVAVQRISGQLDPEQGVGGVDRLGEAEEQG